MCREKAPAFRHADLLEGKLWQGLYGAILALDHEGIALMKTEPLEESYDHGVEFEIAWLDPVEGIGRETIDREKCAFHVPGYTPEEGSSSQPSSSRPSCT